jgi:protein-tyrosine phosphatase
VSLKYSLIFTLISLAATLMGLAAWDSIGLFAVPFFWLALSLLLVAIAFGGVGPRLLRKKPNGRQSIWAWLMFAPYFTLNLLTIRLYQWTSSEPAFVSPVTNLFFGRRLTPSECAIQPWVGVLDLAVEFTEVRALRGVREYRSMPVLDTTAPSEAQLLEAVMCLKAILPTGPVYVHCALGTGRSACVVIAYLLSAGEVATVGECIRRLRALRPGVRLSRAQRECLVAFESRPRPG